MSTIQLEGADSSGTESVAASYEFTTLTTVPGTMTYNGARLQVLDLPGIIQGAKDGKGRGKQVIAVARTCNLIFIVLDVLKPLVDLAILTDELEGFGIRLNKKPPNITVKKRETGGVSIINTVPLTKIDAGEIKAVMSEYRMTSATVTIHEPDCTIEDLIDVVEGNRCVSARDAANATECTFHQLSFSTRLMPFRSRSSTSYTKSPTRSPSPQNCGSTLTN